MKVVVMVGKPLSIELFFFLRIMAFLVLYSTCCLCLYFSNRTSASTYSPTSDFPIARPMLHMALSYVSGRAHANCAPE